MKKLLTLLTALLTAAWIMAQSSVIKIKVVDEQNLNLPGAYVTLEDTRYSDITDENGLVTLSDIPPGNHTLRVVYLGYTDFTSDIVTTSTTTEITANLQPANMTLEGVVVFGDRLRGQAKALNQQKNSDNITNIISSDQVGRFPDANVGDAIKRVPGITMQNDQGEARNIVIRGMGPEFNSVTLNGERIPSAEGDNRRVQMDLIPVDIIQTIEVNKTLTADMDADAIGGSVNLVTRTPPNGLRVTGTLAGGIIPIRDDGFTGTGSFLIGNRFANDKLGFILSGSYNRNQYGSDNVESAWLKDMNGTPFVGDHDVRTYDILRIRRSVSGNLDYQINTLHSLSLSGTYNWRDDKENRYRLRHRYRGDEEDFINDLIYDANGNIAGYSNGEVLRQTKGGLDNSRNENARLEDQRVRSLSISGDHLFGLLKTDWSVQYAKASELRPNERYISMGRRGITIMQDIVDSQFPLLTDNTELINYTRLNELTEQFQEQNEQDINAKLNFELATSLIRDQQGALRFGARIRTKEKIRNNNFFEYEPISSFNNISVLPLIDKTNPDFFPGSKYVAGQFVDPTYLGSLDLTNSGSFEESDAPAEYLAGNFNAKESILAGYVLLKQNLSDKFSVNLGVRVENTSIDYTGNIVVDEEDLTGTATLENDYTDVLPNLNLTYAFSQNVVLKAAYTNTLARPRYYDLVPYFNVLAGDQELSAGNPQLTPVRSSNIDLMMENYFESVGLISAGVFHKTIDKFFYTYLDPNYTTENFAADFPTVANPIAVGDNWEFSQRRNGDGATLFGFEVGVQRQLDFMPGFLQGFGVYVNYTYTDSKAEGIYNGGELVRSDVALPGAAPHIFNASLSYELKKFSARLSTNYTSSYVDDSDDAGYNADAFFDRYYDKQFFLDANASYAFTPNWRVFAEANNLTNQPLRYYQSDQNLTAQVEYYGPKFNIGINYDLSK